MLLVMHNLPSHMKYSDIKQLIHKNCYIKEIILDKLVHEGSASKRVTIGVARENDALTILQRLNGTIVDGLQIFIEEVKRGNSEKSYDRNRSSMDYSINPKTEKSFDRNMSSMHYSNNQKSEKSFERNSSNVGSSNNQNFNSQNQMANYQITNNPWDTNSQMHQHFYGMADQSVSYQNQGMNQQDQGYSGYNATGLYGVINSSGIAPLMQSSFMAHGTQQGQQQQNTSQWQFGSSELGWGTPHNQEGGIQKGFDNQHYSGGNDDKSYGHKEDNGLYYRGRDDYGLGNSRVESRDADRESRGYGNKASGNEERGFRSQDTREFQEESWRNRGGRGFSREGDRPRDRDAGRKRKHNPARDNYSNRDRCQSGSRGNQGFDECESRDSGFGRNHEKGFYGPNSCGNHNRGGAPWDSFPAKAPSKPYQSLNKPSKPYSWSNNLNKSFDNLQSLSSANPFGNNQVFNNQNIVKSQVKQRDDSKAKPVQWTRSQPLPPGSVKATVPAKRAKFFEDPANEVIEYATDQKNIQRAETWRGQGVSMIVKNIVSNNLKLNSTASRELENLKMKMLKQAVHRQLDEILKEKFPEGQHPMLQDYQLNLLYRDVHPPEEDKALFDAYYDKNKEEPAAKPKLTRFEIPNWPPADLKIPKPKPAGAKSKPGGAQAKPGGAQTKPGGAQTKPGGAQTKPGGAQAKSGVLQPTLSDLLPPALLQANTQFPPPPRPRGKKEKAAKPIREKRATFEQKQIQKREFLEPNFYKCKTPAMEKALNAVLDEITNVYKKSVEEYETTNNDEKLIGKSIIDKTVPEFRAMARLHTIKRLLNCTATLMVRVFVRGGKAPKTEVKRVLEPYGVTTLRTSKSSKTQMLMAGVNSFANFDKLCSHTGIAVNGKYGTSFVTCKPLHLTIPMKYRRLQVQGIIDDQDDEDADSGDKNNDEDDHGFSDEDNDLLPSEDDNVLLSKDDNLLSAENDDDVIEIVKETDVIEISGDGDETTLNVPDDIKNDDSENLDESGEATKDNTVDFTEDEELAADALIDEKISEGIAEQMGDAVVEIDEDEIDENDLEDY